MKPGEIDVWDDERIAAALREIPGICRLFSVNVDVAGRLSKDLSRTAWVAPTPVRTIQSRVIASKKFEIRAFIVGSYPTDDIVFPMLHDLEWIPDSVVEEDASEFPALSAWPSSRSMNRIDRRLGDPAIGLRLYSKAYSRDSAPWIVVAGRDDGSLAIGEVVARSSLD